MKRSRSAERNSDLSRRWRYELVSGGWRKREHRWSINTAVFGVLTFGNYDAMKYGDKIVWC
ncbi:MAG: hypothetical protein KDK08_05920 [Rhizobiaceae bacterium]|nr:hypothetical protein [Rhizobiaceae bacterium]MCC0000996.1 hypothetical protein [Methylobacteriaceae bacterium]